MSSLQNTFAHLPLQQACGEPEAAAAAASAPAPTPAPVVVPAPAPTPARSRAIWSVEDDDILMDVLFEAQARGARFTFEWDAIWEEAAARVNSRSSRRLGAKKTGKKCHLRLLNLKLTLSDVEHLRENLGVEWDGDRKMLVATPERWDELVERNQRFKKFRDNPWPQYTKIKLLLSKTRVKPEYATNSPLSAAKIEAEVDPPMFGPIPQLLPQETWQRGTLQHPTTPLSLSTGFSPPLAQAAEPSEATTLRSLSTEATQTPQRHMSPPRPVDDTSVSSDVSALPVPSTATEAHNSLIQDSAATALSCGGRNSISDAMGSEEHRTEAIRLMEADDAYSVDEQVSIVELFEERPATVRSFLAIKNKHVRTLYVRRALAQHNRSPSGRAGSCIIA
ncbi:Myb/SANT-like DNA-binding domain-containing protein [Phanerochaete sordida]|uniref:Myb/SANT-like DNA-binding domain-containing protein n=1 Tax=Phanerochaete sordida TaxID=48140 RepID=A0A9P3GLY0_9APHY|nr:Myb/SANT-like DNA-binding domain-containing protein [Phanerochaete sordida]